MAELRYENDSLICPLFFRPAEALANGLLAGRKVFIGILGRLLKLQTALFSDQSIFPNNPIALNGQAKTSRVGES